MYLLSVMGCSCWLLGQVMDPGTAAAKEFKLKLMGSTGLSTISKRTRSGPAWSNSALPGG